MQRLSLQSSHLAFAHTNTGSFLLVLFGRLVVTHDTVRPDIRTVARCGDRSFLDGYPPPPRSLYFFFACLLPLLLIQRLTPSLEIAARLRYVTIPHITLDRLHVHSTPLPLPGQRQAARRVHFSFVLLPVPTYGSSNLDTWGVNEQHLLHARL